MEMKRIFMTVLAAGALAFSAVATELPDSLIPRITKGRPHHPEMDEKVIVGNDTVPLIIPERNFGRYDRGLFNYLFIPKGQWAFGLTASYGEFDASDVEVLQFLNDLNFNGRQYAIRPTVSYFFRSNQSVGLKFDYTRQEADVDHFAMNAGDDLSFDIRDVSFYSSKYSIGIFYRNYVGLGRSKRFAVFNEVALSFGSGSSRFKRPYNNVMHDTRTDMTEATLNFSPGICVFVVDHLSFNVSFGVFGLHMRHDKQVTDLHNTDGTVTREEEGSRFSSGANFRFNLFNINFGIGVHI